MIPGLMALIRAPEGPHSGDAAALVISGNADGSLKLTQSRVVTASGVGAAAAAALNVI